MVVAAVLAGTVSADSVGLAVCFLYRHYIEVMLKDLIRQGFLLHETTHDYPKNSHKIADLWARCRPILEQTFPQGDPGATETVDRCINEIASDPSGEAFRLGETATGTGSNRDRSKWACKTCGI